MRRGNKHPLASRRCISETTTYLLVCLVHAMEMQASPDGKGFSGLLAVYRTRRYCPRSASTMDAKVSVACRDLSGYELTSNFARSRLNVGA